MSNQSGIQPNQHYIGGEWTDDNGSETFASESPPTRETLAEFQRGTEADVDAALAAVDDATEEWRERSYIDRSEYLWVIYHELRDRHQELGEVVSKECGKEISEGKADVTETWHMVEWAAGSARHPHGVFNMVQGFGDAGAAITDDERVDTVLFTGSAEVGQEIASKVGGEPGKRAACEMGGKNGIT